MKILPKRYTYVWFMRSGYIHIWYSWGYSYESAREKMLKKIRQESEEYANTHFFEHNEPPLGVLLKTGPRRIPMEGSYIKDRSLTFVAKEVRKPESPHRVADYKVELTKRYFSKSEKEELGL